MPIEIYPISYFQKSPLEQFVTGAETGMDKMVDYRKKAADLEKTLAQNAADRKLQEGIAAQDQGADYGGKGRPGEPGYEYTTSFTNPDGTTGTTTTGGGSGGSSGTGGSGGSGGIEAGQLYQYLTSQGASKNEATLLTSAANAESSFMPNTIHDGGIGYGLWGHNTDRLQAMYTSAGMDPNSKPGTPIPWEKQADFALHELRQRFGTSLDKMTTPDQLTDAQLAYEMPKGWNTGGGNRPQRLASTTEYFNNPPTYTPPSTTQTTALSSPGTTQQSSSPLPDVPSYGPDLQRTTPAPAALAPPPVQTSALGGPNYPPGSAAYRGGLPPTVAFNSQGVPYNPQRVGAGGVATPQGGIFGPQPGARPEGGPDPAQQSYYAPPPVMQPGYMPAGYVPPGYMPPGQQYALAPPTAGYGLGGAYAA